MGLAHLYDGQNDGPKRFRLLYSETATWKKDPRVSRSEWGGRRKAPRAPAGPVQGGRARAARGRHADLPTGGLQPAAVRPQSHRTVNLRRGELPGLRGHVTAVL